MSEVAIVTGASRGIGREICLKLASLEHTVIAVARSEISLAELEQNNPRFIHSYSVDLTDQKKVIELADELKNDFRNIDILINNAGALVNKPFEKLTLNDWRAQIESNLISAVSITKQLLPLFNESSHIVNISSMGGYQGSKKFPGLSAYSVAKGALTVLTECLSIELKKRKINANALCLGAVQTKMFEEAFPGIQAPVQADEVGAYITDFALKGHRFYNGKILPVALQDPE